MRLDPEPATDTQSRVRPDHGHITYLIALWVVLFVVFAFGVIMWLQVRELPFGHTYIREVSRDFIYAPPKPGHYAMPEDERTATRQLSDVLGVKASEDPADLWALSSALNARWVQADEPVGVSMQAAAISGLAEGRGSDLMCGSIAWTFVRLCRLEGVPARSIQLQRTIASGSDTHVVAEVYTGGRWILVDPTFDLHYELDGRVMTALDMRDWVLENPFTRPAVDIVRGTSANSPAIEEYYVNPYFLFNVVTFSTPNDPGIWDGIGVKIPFVRAFVRPRLMSPHENAGLPFESMNLLDYALDA